MLVYRSLLDGYLMPSILARCVMYNDIRFSSNYVTLKIYLRTISLNLSKKTGIEEGFTKEDMQKTTGAHSQGEGNGLPVDMYKSSPLLDRNLTRFGFLTLEELNQQHAISLFCKYLNSGNPACISAGIDDCS